MCVCWVPRLSYRVSVAFNLVVDAGLSDADIKRAARMQSLAAQGVAALARVEAMRADTLAQQDAEIRAKHSNSNALKAQRAAEKAALLAQLKAEDVVAAAAAATQTAEATGHQGGGGDIERDDIKPKSLLQGTRVNVIADIPADVLAKLKGAATLATQPGKIEHALDEPSSPSDDDAVAWEGDPIWEEAIDGARTMLSAPGMGKTTPTAPSKGAGEESKGDCGLDYDCVRHLLARMSPL